VTSERLERGRSQTKVATALGNALIAVAASGAELWLGVRPAGS
jgi:hypothetical protein